MPYLRGHVCRKGTNLEFLRRHQHMRVDGRAALAPLITQQLNPRVVADPVFRQRAFLEHDRAIEDEALLRGLCCQLSVALANATLFTELEEARRLSQAVFESCAGTVMLISAAPAAPGGEAEPAAPARVVELEAQGAQRRAQGAGRLQVEGGSGKWSVVSSKDL